MNEKQKFRAVIIGCGVISYAHIHSLLLLDNVEIVGLCDVKPLAAEKRREEFSLDLPIYTDYKVMLDELSPDSVHICTPHYLHAEMAEEALSRGMNVFLEKPACITNEEAERLLSAEERSKGKLCVCFQNRTNPAMVKMRELVSAAEKVYGARANVSWYRDASYYSDEWHGKRALEGGGVMINQAIHTLDLFLYYCGIKCGKPVSVDALTANRHLQDVIDVEDTCDARILFESGAVGLFTASSAYVKDSQNIIEIVTSEGDYLLYGENLYHNGKPVEVENSDRVILGKACYGNGHERLIAGYYDALENDFAVPISLSSSLPAVQVLLASYASNEQKKPIKM